MAIKSMRINLVAKATLGFFLSTTIVAYGYVFGEKECEKAMQTKHCIEDLRMGYATSKNDYAIKKLPTPEFSHPRWRGDIGEAMLYSGYIGFLNLDADATFLKERYGFTMQEFSEITNYISATGLLNNWRTCNLIPPSM